MATALTRFRWLQSTALLVGAIVCFVATGLLHDHYEAVLGLIASASILDGNAISGVTSEASYQVLGRAQLVGIGVGMLLVGWSALGVLTQVGGPARLVLRRALLRPGAGVVLLVALIAFGIFHARSALVDGERFLALDDDAMISMRYAYNFSRGRGLTFVTGEQVEGYTNFLWVVLMSVPFLLGASLRVAPMFVLTANFVLIAGTALCMVGLLRKLRCPTWAALVAVVAFLFDCDTIYFGASGLETSLLTFLVTASSLALLRGRPQITFALLGLLPLVRSDAALLSGLLALTAAWQLRKNGVRAFRAAPLVVLLPLVHVLFRRAYYGEWYPNTYFLKMLELHDRLVLGVGGYAFRIVWMYGTWILLAIAATSLPRRRGVIVGWVCTFLVQCAYSVFVGGDAFWFLRFLAPLLPLIFVTGARTLGSFRPTTRVATVALVTLGLGITPVQTAFGRLGKQVPLAPWIRMTVATSRWLDANVQPGASSTIYPAGTVPYYSPELRFLDVLGKNDHHIAHARKYESLVIGHNRFDFDYVYDERKPDLALPDRGCGDFEAPRWMNETERAALRQHPDTRSPAWDYDRTHPTFMQRYAGNAVHFLGPPPYLLGCIFVRDDSSVPLFWSAQGTPPRATSVSWRFAGPNEDGRIALAGRWNVTAPTAEAPLLGVSGTAGVGNGDVDVWVKLDAPLAVTACLPPRAIASPWLQALRVNDRPIGTGTELTPEGECQGPRIRWHVTPEILASRQTTTRLQFAVGAAMTSVAVSP